MRILIIEDEVKIAGYLKKGLTENGFIADFSHTGKDGFFFASNSDYDLILLDVILPEVGDLVLLS